MIMKIKKYILGLSVAVLGVLSSCNTDVEGPLYQGTSEHVSFDAASLSVSVSSDESSVTIPVVINRGILKEASTYTFTAVASEDGIFSNDAVEGRISFAEGQNTVIVNVVASNLEKEQTYVYTLTLSDEAKATADVVTGVVQNTECVITVKREGDWTAWEEWNSAKTADYYYSGSFFDGDDPNLNFTYRQSELDENRYQFRLEHWGNDTEFIMDYDKNTGRITCAPQYSGYTYTGYGAVMVTDLATMKGILGIAASAEDYGSFDEEQGIITIPLVYYIPDFNNYIFGYDPEYVYIDGYTRADLSSSLTYAGILINPQGEVLALGKLKLGADVQKALALVVSADDDADAVADALAAGELEGISVKDGDIQVPIGEDLSGDLQLVVAVVNDDAVASYASVFFEYYAGGASPWKSLGKGLYTEGLVSDAFGLDALTYEVEIKENTENPGLYRLIDPYGSAWEYASYNNATPCEYLEVNATDPTAVYILPQMIGVNLDGANLGLASMGGYYLSSGEATIEDLKTYGMMGTNDNGVITFPTFTSGDDPEAEDFYTYQGILYYGENSYDGINNMKIVLPEAVTASLRARVKATKFANNMRCFRARLNEIKSTKTKHINKLSFIKAKFRK